MVASILVSTENLLYRVDIYPDELHGIDEATLTKTAGNKPIAHFTMPSFRTVTKFIRSYEAMLERHCKDYVPEKNADEVTRFVSNRNGCWLNLSGDEVHIKYHNQIVDSYDANDDMRLPSVFLRTEYLFNKAMKRKPKVRTTYDDYETELSGDIVELDFSEVQPPEFTGRVNAILHDMDIGGINIPEKILV